MPDPQPAPHPEGPTLFVSLGGHDGIIQLLLRILQVFKLGSQTRIMHSEVVYNKASQNLNLVYNKASKNLSYPTTSKCHSTKSSSPSCSLGKE